MLPFCGKMEKKKKEAFTALASILGAVTLWKLIVRYRRAALKVCAAFLSSHSNSVPARRLPPFPQEEQSWGTSAYPTFSHQP